MDGLMDRERDRGRKDTYHGLRTVSEIPLYRKKEKVVTRLKWQIIFSNN